MEIKDLRGLVLTEEQAQGVDIYRAFIQEKRHAGRLRRYLAEIEDEFGDIDEETKWGLAEARYAKVQSDLNKIAYAARVERLKGGE
jgi:hypothetical protein